MVPGAGSPLAGDLIRSASLRVLTNEIYNTTFSCVLELLDRLIRSGDFLPGLTSPPGRGAGPFPCDYFTYSDRQV